MDAMWRKPFTILGLETSCDETAAAVVRGVPPGPGEIVSNITYSQVVEHRPYGGVVPEIAARAHVELLDGIIARALSGARIELSDVDGIAATAGPGLIGGVIVGLTAAKALALGADKPLVAINHLEAHALSGRLCGNVRFPFLLLLISGGHCQLVAAERLGQYTRYGATIDDAVGECFDKTAKLLGLAYPGGPQIEQLARTGNPKSFALPRPMLGREGADFSFSGLKTAIRQIAAARQPLDEKTKAGLAASFQAAVVDVLVDRVSNAMQRFRESFGIRERFDFVAAGGVAANSTIRETLTTVAATQNFALSLPPPEICTDNGAMVAWAGLERLALGLTDPLDAPPRDRWPLETLHHAGTVAHAEH
jgi:tRNA N6-adenosine threonylcarbamoyltransferase